MCMLQCHQKIHPVKKLMKQKCPKQLNVLLFHITCEIINKSKFYIKFDTIFNCNLILHIYSRAQLIYTANVQKIHAN